MGLIYNVTSGKEEYIINLEDGSSGGEVKEVALLSITTAPTGEFAKGSKYYNLTDKKIYTAVVADSWDGATVDDPQFGTYYIYDNFTYVWDGDSLEKYNLEDFIPKTDIVNDLTTADPTKVLGAGQGKVLDEKVEVKQNITDNNLETTDKTVVGAINELDSDKQDKTDNALTTTSKTVVGAINEINTEVDLKQNITDNNLTTNAKTIVGAINELDNNKQNITDNNLETEAKTVVGAINEINQAMIGLPDLIIAENKILNKPLFYNGRIIINSGVTITVNEPLKSLIIKCKELINNGIIDVSGKGFQGKKVLYGEGIGYANGDNVETTTGSRAGGGAPSSDKPSAYRTMLGLASAVGGSYQAPYGPGYDGTNGGGGGGASDGGPLSGGGSGAGGGGGGAGHGSYDNPKGGNGSQADISINLELFKNNQLEEIPLFGASGASGWQDWQATSKDTSNGGGNIQIYADKLENNGIIRANGETIYLTSPEQNGGCGGGGGGCIMIRTPNIINGTGSVIEAKGSEGHQYSTYEYGGNGGDGLVLIDNNKTFLEQFKDMPEANITNLGRIVQYVGETNQFYTNGYFYKSVSDGQATPTYHWEAVFNAINHTMYEITISPNSLYLSSLTGGQALFIPITQVGKDITGIAIVSFSCQTSASIPSGSAIASMTISGYNLLAVGDFVSFANSSSSRYACPIQVTENSNSIYAKDASISGKIWVSLVFMAKFQVA